MKSLVPRIKYLLPFIVTNLFFPTAGFSQYSKNVKLMTYNICALCNEGGDYQYITEAIAAINPDICGLQEVDSVNSRNFNDVVKLLGQANNKKYSFSATSRNVEGGSYGDAMLYNAEPDSIKYFFHKQPGATLIGVTESHITMDGEHVLVYNTHLSYQKSEFRVNQVKLILEWIDESNDPNTPRIILGDFNSRSDAPAMNEFYSAGYDIVKYASNNEAPAAVDHILFRPSHRWKVKGLGSPKKYKGSDHSLVWASMEITDEVTTLKIPKTKFEADRFVTFKDGEINFYDNSLNNPDKWEWIFEGGIPNKSSEQNPIVFYEQEGTFSVQLTTSNSNGSNIKSKENIISVVDEITSLKTNISIINSIFPNPNKGYFKIRNTDGENITGVLIIANITGSIVYKDSNFILDGSSTKLIDVSFLSNGSYILLLQDQRGVRFREIIVINK